MLRGVPCKLWGGAVNGAGYGRRWYPPLGKTEFVHRIAWIEARGPIPPGLEVDHECSTPACFEVAHLRLLTHRGNLLAGSTTLAAVNAAKTMCPHGHAYDRVDTRGKRVCKTCNRDGARRRYTARS